MPTFDPESMGATLNSYATEGRRVVTLKSAKGELMIALEQAVGPRL